MKMKCRALNLVFVLVVVVMFAGLCEAPPIRHPFLIVKENMYNELQARAEVAGSVWEKMKEDAQDDYFIIDEVYIYSRELSGSEIVDVVRRKLCFLTV